MKVITDLVDLMEQELDLAKIYAQSYLIFSSENNREWAKRFEIMTKESLAHADNIHSLAVDNIQQLEKSYTPPESMSRIWNKKHSYYIDTTNWIKDMIK